jgi:hypothetical protein
MLNQLDMTSIDGCRISLSTACSGATHMTAISGMLRSPNNMRRVPECGQQVFALDTTRASEHVWCQKCFTALGRIEVYGLTVRTSHGQSAAVTPDGR